MLAAIIVQFENFEQNWLMHTGLDWKFLILKLSFGLYCYKETSYGQNYNISAVSLVFRAFNRYLYKTYKTKYFCFIYFKRNKTSQSWKFGATSFATTQNLVCEPFCLHLPLPICYWTRPFEPVQCAMWAEKIPKEALFNGLLIFLSLLKKNSDVHYIRNLDVLFWTDLYDINKWLYKFVNYFILFRITCIAPMGIPHHARDDISISDKFMIPKGTLIFPNLHRITRNPDAFQEPNDFKPERFLDEHGKYVKNEHNVPFSVGE